MSMNLSWRIPNSSSTQRDLYFGIKMAHMEFTGKELWVLGQPFLPYKRLGYAVAFLLILECCQELCAGAGMV